jgi:branched-chain amino acid aminotransferase
MTGTAAHLTAVIDVDRRPIGTGLPGEITKRLHERYHDALQGREEKYAKWLIPVKPQVAGKQGVKA